MYQAVQYINRNSLPGEKVLGVGTESIRFYLQNSMSTPNEGDRYPKNVDLREMAASLARNGFVFLLIHERKYEHFIPYITESFLTQYAVLEYVANNTYVYRLRETAAPPAVETNFLTNPGFELKKASGLPAHWVVYGQSPRIIEDAARAHTGQISVLADQSGGLATRVLVESDKIYSLGHWSRADLPKQRGRLQINWLDANQKVIDVTINVFQAEKKWAWHQLSAVAPAKASLAQIYVSVDDNSEVFFDDYVFVQGQLQARQ
jgi:hypothetical protein